MVHNSILHFFSFLFFGWSWAIKSVSVGAFANSRIASGGDSEPFHRFGMCNGKKIMIFITIEFYTASGKHLWYAGNIISCVVMRSTGNSQNNNNKTSSRRKIPQRSRYTSSSLWDNNEKLADHILSKIYCYSPLNLWIRSKIARTSKMNILDETVMCGWRG